MTVSYAADVASVRGLPSCFVRLLKRWRGSIYKLMYCELIVFLTAYYSLAILYRYGLNEKERANFENVVSYFNAYNKTIPVSFVLGFYVTIVVDRWVHQVSNIPWPDSPAVYVSTHLRGQDDQGRMMRRTVMRYLNLSQIMVYVMISPKAKKRFPTYDHMVQAGVLNENEKKIFLALDEIYPKLPKYWMPIVWASSIFTRARKEGRIRDEYALRALNDAFNQFRVYCITLLHYDTISIPLVYTQVVSLAVYSYFFAAIIGQQELPHTKSNGYMSSVNYYFPVFVALEFFFYMGWLKVAESLICPFGEDDDDFDINYFIDRNLQISYFIVDEMHNRHPLLMKDTYWDEGYPYELPGGGTTPPEHSTARLGMQPETRSSDGDINKPAKSDMQLIYKRRKKSSKLSTESDDDDALNDEILREVTPLLSEPEISKQTQVAEEEQAEQDDELTFEKLKEDREREKVERQQQKVHSTVEKAAEITAELPKIVRKRKQTDASTEEDTSQQEETDDNDDDKKKQQ